MANHADPDQLASVCKGRTYPGPAGVGLTSVHVRRWMRNVDLPLLFTWGGRDEGNFCDIMFAFLHTKSLLTKEFTAKRKNLLPTEASSYILE